MSEKDYILLRQFIMYQWRISHIALEQAKRFKWIVFDRQSHKYIWTAKGLTASKNIEKSINRRNSRRY